ncbi:MAG TPA: Gfo/Idh/MocA family oxidoreductase [Bryobacteraceae bacterium]|nr:Gfo/Idh/MocA family oxidoreductase [Bryobacteraceae bacterium]
MNSKVRWAVLGVARIATEKVIPAMQRSESCEVVAIASRSLGRATEAARRLGIPKAFGSYEEVLQDPEIEAVYNPLPNHLHVPWSIRAAEAGKHVLCEKPVAMSVEECRKLMAVRDRTGVKMGEAFMVRTHPQWLRARELVRSGEIGNLRAIMGAFSFFNRDPANIRNVREFGGGGLMDIGCYPIQMSRFLFEAEPQRVTALIEYDPEYQVDRLSSAVLGFPSGHCVFTCSTQLVYYQRIQILGTKGRIEVEVPFNPSPQRNSRLLVDSGADLWGGGIRIEELPACDQYTIQADSFCRAVRNNGDVPTPLEDSLANMAVIEAVLESARTGGTVRQLSAARE